MVLCSAAAVQAQQPASGQDHPDAPSATKSADSARRKPPADVFSTINRKSIFFPNIATTEGPLSTGGKFKLFVDNSASLSTLIGSALSAGIDQADDTPRGYGQGGEGYAKRFGAAMARNASSHFFGTFLLASMLRQDPRFFPQADPTFGGSIKYALTRVVVTRNDEGNDTANWSGLLGPLMAEGLANAYWPEQERTAGQTFKRYGWDLASRAGANMLRNYWPVFFKRLRGSPHSSARNN
ncbi:MAG: hypothetical protein WAQ52_01765 [Terriglobales bacterium]